jgi:hypothetical protein
LSRLILAEAEDVTVAVFAAHAGGRSTTRDLIHHLLTS